MANYKLCSIHTLWNIKMFWPFHWKFQSEMMTCVSLWKVHRKNCEIRSLKKYFQIKNFRNKIQTYEVDPLIKDFICNIFGWWWSCQNRIWYLSKGWQWCWWPFSSPTFAISKIRHQHLNLVTNTNSFQHSSSIVNSSCFKQIACLGRLKE